MTIDTVLKSDLIRMYIEVNVPLEKVADNYDTDLEGIIQILNENGIRLKNEDKCKDKDWLYEKYIESDMNIENIAESCNVSEYTISSWLDKHEIQTNEGRTGKTGKKDICRYNLVRYALTNGYPTWSATGSAADANYLRVHRLVIIAHGADPYEVFDNTNNMQVHHRNGFKCDNRPENLELIDSRTHGRYHTPDNVKWTDDDLEYVLKAMLNPTSFIE